MGHNPWLREIRGETPDGDEHAHLRSIERKKTSETESDYLVRSFRHYFGEETRLWKRIRKRIGTIGSVVDPFGTQSIIEKLRNDHKTISDRLSESIRNMGTVSPMQADIVGRQGALLDIKNMQDPIEFDIPPNPLHETNERMNELVVNIEELKKLFTEVVGLISSMDNITLRMQEELSTGVKKSTRISLSLLVIACISLGVTAWYSYWSYQESGTSTEYQRIFLERIEELADHQRSIYSEMLIDQEISRQTLIDRQDFQTQQGLRLLQPISAEGLAEDPLDAARDGP